MTPDDFEIGTGSCAAKNAGGARTSARASSLRFACPSTAMRLGFRDLPMPLPKPCSTKTTCRPVHSLSPRRHPDDRYLDRGPRRRQAKPLTRCTAPGCCLLHPPSASRTCSRTTSRSPGTSACCPTDPGSVDWTRAATSATSTSTTTASRRPETASSPAGDTCAPISRPVRRTSACSAGRVASRFRPVPTMTCSARPKACHCGRKCG